MIGRDVVHEAEVAEDAAVRTERDRPVIAGCAADLQRACPADPVAVEGEGLGDGDPVAERERRPVGNRHARSAGAQRRVAERRQRAAQHRRLALIGIAARQAQRAGAGLGQRSGARDHRADRRAHARGRVDPGRPGQGKPRSRIAPFDGVAIDEEGKAARRHGGVGGDGHRAARARKHGVEAVACPHAGEDAVVLGEIAVGEVPGAAAAHHRAGRSRGRAVPVDQILGRRGIEDDARAIERQRADEPACERIERQVAERTGERAELEQGIVPVGKACVLHDLDIAAVERQQAGDADQIVVEPARDAGLAQFEAGERSGVERQAAHRQGARAVARRQRGAAVDDHQAADGSRAAQRATIDRDARTQRAVDDQPAAADRGAAGKGIRSGKGQRAGATLDQLAGAVCVHHLPAEGGIEGTGDINRAAELEEKHPGPFKAADGFGAEYRLAGRSGF